MAKLILLIVAILILVSGCAASAEPAQEECTPGKPGTLFALTPVDVQLGDGCVEQALKPENGAHEQRAWCCWKGSDGARELETRLSAE